MKTSVPCPYCERRISVLRVAMAPSPLHLRCPHCLRPLRVQRVMLPLLAAGIALGLILGTRLIREARLVGGLPLKALALALVIVLGFNLLASLLVVNLGKISKRE